MPEKNAPLRRERDPERSKAKIKAAVGSILRKKGYTALTVGNIAKEAGVGPRLVTYYYETIELLIEEYLSEKDYWLTFAQRMEDAISKENPSDLEELLYAILMAHMDGFESDPEMQKLITWEISEPTDLMIRESETREEFSALIFSKIDPFFEGTDVDIRFVSMLLIGGVYYGVLHAYINGTTFCGTDIRTEEGKMGIRKAIHQVISWAFSNAEATRKKSKT